MQTLAENADLRQRRKQVRVEVRRDLEVTPQQAEGRRQYVIKDPIGLRYWRFKEREHFLFERLTGEHTLDAIRTEYEQRFRPERLTLEEVEAFARQLVSAGLAHPTATDPGRQVLERQRKLRHKSALTRVQQILAIQVPLFNPDRLLTKMLPALGWLCTRAFFALSMVLVLAALVLVATHFDDFRHRLPSAQAFFTWQSAFYLWLAVGLVKVVHEFGHGLSCKAMGGEVHEMGALVLCFAPCLYCTVTDAWRLPSKWQRMAISFAGIHVELVIAALATFVWWHASPATFIYQLSMSLMLACSVNTVLLNGNPLMRYDGYHVLADWVELPNLRERAGAWWQRWLLEHGLGVEVARDPEMAAWRQGLLAVYGVASFIYRWVVTAGALWFFSQFLVPHRLGAVAVVLGVLTVLTGILEPIMAFSRGLPQGGRMPAMKSGQVVRGVLLLAAALAAFMLVPLPVSGIRQVGLLAVQPDAVARVFVPSSATLERLHVHEGQRVEAGDLLADLRSLELENHRAAALAEQEIQAVRVQALREMVAASFAGPEQARLEANLAVAMGDRARATRQCELFDGQLRGLQVRAPRRGVVMGLPRVDALGKLWEKDAGIALCSIGDPSRLWVELPLGPGNFRLLRDELAASRGTDHELAIRVRERGRQGATWTGTVARLPEAEARELPLALTQPAGGPVAVKPGGANRGPVPQSQQYLVAVAVCAPDGGLAPGGLAQVSIRCQWHSAAWWLWRELAGAFDLKLL